MKKFEEMVNVNEVENNVIDIAIKMIIDAIDATRNDPSFKKLYNNDKIMMKKVNGTIIKHRNALDRDLQRLN